jgi:thiol-disulfide isomerase/thioredoxin
MKNYFKILLLLLLVSKSISAKPFSINGQVTGSEPLKYAYVFDNDNSRLIRSTPIANKKFSFYIEVPDHPRFGVLPSVQVLLTTDSLSVDEINNRRLGSKRKHYNCNILAENSIRLIYDSDRKMFSIEGGELNKIQNIYENRLALYRNTRDSLFKLIKTSTVDEETKNRKIDRVGAELFTAAMRDFVQIIKKYPDQVSLFNFDVIIYDQGISGYEVKEAFNYFPQSLRDSEYGRHLYKDIEDKLKSEVLLERPVYKVGMKFPDFSLIDDRDVLRHGVELYGKYTLVDFWATWCGPCRKETPNLLEAYQAYHAKGFNIVTISIDDKEDKQKWLNALKDDKMSPFHNLFNGSDVSGISRELKVVAIPMNYLLDDQGMIVATNLRGEQLVLKLRKLCTQ